MMSQITLFLNILLEAFDELLIKNDNFDSFFVIFLHQKLIILPLYLPGSVQVLHTVYI